LSLGCVVAGRCGERWGRGAEEGIASRPAVFTGAERRKKPPDWVEIPFMKKVLIPLSLEVTYGNTALLTV
jgi:hypothetical protein